MRRVVSLGCRLNAFEGDLIERHLREAGRETYVVNTCAVTQEAERQARQLIRKLKREHPEAEIAVTGCAAQIAPEAWAALDEVTRVVGNEEKLRPEAWGAEAAEVQVGDIMAVRETAPHLLEAFSEARTRAFVQVQQGCDHRCTFCIIPYGRGNARSVPLGAVVQQVRALVEAGSQEVVLTGVDLTSYGPDLPGQPSLGQMVRRLLAQVPELPRLRLSSIDCIEMDTDLKRLVAEEPRLMPHLHLSLQSGADLILKRMKRRHGRDEALALVRELRDLRPELALGADLIAGFPTETEAHFQDTLELVEEANLAYVHVFPYSERPGTPAARMPQVPKSERKARAARLRDKARQAFDRFLVAQVGKTQEVLVEQGGLARGENYAPYQMEGAVAGQRLRVTARGVVGQVLQGQAA